MKNNIMSISEKDVNLTALSLRENIDITAIDNINDATAAVWSLDQLSGLFLLKKIKLFEIVLREKLYEKGEPRYKSFGAWALKNFGLGEKSAYRYAQVAFLVDENGDASVLKPDTERVADYGYTALSLFVQAFGKDVDAMRLFISKAKITPATPISQLKKALKTLGYLGKGKDMTEEAQPAEKPAETPAEKPADAAAEVPAEVTADTEAPANKKEAPATATWKDVEKECKKAVTEGGVTITAKDKKGNVVGKWFVVG